MSQAHCDKDIDIETTAQRDKGTDKDIDIETTAHRDKGTDKDKATHTDKDKEPQTTCHSDERARGSASASTHGVTARQATERDDDLASPHLAASSRRRIAPSNRAVDVPRAHGGRQQLAVAVGRPHRVRGALCVRADLVGTAQAPRDVPPRVRYAHERARPRRAPCP